MSQLYRNVSPTPVVDWGAPVREARHAIRNRGVVVSHSRVPVYHGLDRETAHRLRREHIRHGDGRWAGSRYDKRNETGGHMLVPAITIMAEGKVRHITWRIITGENA